MILTTALISHFHTSAGQGEADLVRPNHGVLLKLHGKRLIAGQSHLDLVFTVPRPRIIQEMIPPCLSDPRSTDNHPWCNLFKDEKPLLLQLLGNIQATQQGIATLLHSPINLDNAGRNARAPLEFVSSISKSLFGIARQKDVDKVKNTVNAIIRHVDAKGKFVDTEFGLIHKAINTTAETIKTIQDEIIGSQALIVQLHKAMESIGKQSIKQARTIEQAVSIIKQIGTYVADVVERKAFVLARLETTAISLNSFLSGVSSLMQGYLSPAILPPFDLQTTLDRAAKHIPLKYPGFTLLHQDLAFYFNHHLASFMYTDEQLIIHVMAPFSKEEAIFDIYRVFSYPIPIHPAETESLGYTQVKDLPEYIAVNAARNTYVELSQAQMSTCTDTDLISCPFDHVFVTRPYFTCAAVILFNQDDQFEDTCNTAVVTHSPVPNNIIPLTQGSYLITTHTSMYKIACPGFSIQSFPARAYAQVSVPCGCSLHVAEMMVTPPVSDCDKNLTSFETLHPINYPVFLSFGFKPHQFSSLNISETPVKLDVPNITEYVTKFKDLSRKAKQGTLDLETVSEAIRSDRESYSKYETQGPSILKFLDSKQSMDVFVIICVIVMIGLAIAVAVVTIKLRKVEVMRKAGYITAATAATTMPTVTEANMIYHPDQDYHVDIPQPLEIDAGENSYLESIITCLQ